VCWRNCAATADPVPNGALLDEKAFPEQVTEVALVADRSAPDRVRLEDLAVIGLVEEPTSR
jgi:hypothetical protein